jgi:N6-adenosine-specific RNA methylase IME4
MTKAEKLESEIIEQPESEDGSVVDDLTNLEQRKFGTIYADPPWQYGNQGTRASTGNHYNTMTLDDICSMPVESLAADDAHLHLWTTNAFLFDAKRVMDAWGFEYRSVFVWVKPQMGIGNYWRVSHEFLLLGIRGNAKRFNEHNHMSWAQIDRSKHSAKPEQIRRTIEKVSNGPYLELFGRNQVHGWTVFGNQVSAQSVLAI